MSVLSLWERLGSCTARGNATLEFLRDGGAALPWECQCSSSCCQTHLRKSTPKLEQRVYLEHGRQNLAAPAAKAIYS